MSSAPTDAPRLSPRLPIQFCVFGVCAAVLVGLAMTAFAMLAAILGFVVD